MGEVSPVSARTTASGLSIWASLDCTDCHGAWPRIRKSECEHDQLDLTNMTDQVNVQDAKTRLSELLARVERGEQITIARAGKPIARLVAVEPPVKRALGFIAGGPLADSFFDALPDDELQRWESA